LVVLLAWKAGCDGSLVDEDQAIINLLTWEMPQKDQTSVEKPQRKVWQQIGIYPMIHIRSTDKNYSIDKEDQVNLLSRVCPPMMNIAARVMKLRSRLSSPRKPKTTQ